MAAETHSWNTELFAWPKGSFSFYVKTQKNRRFSFSPITVLNNVFTVLFHCFLQYCRPLHNSIFPKGFIVWPTQYKASFNKHRSIEIIYNVSEVLSLHFSQNSRQMGLWKVLIFSLYIMSICNILINNLKSKTQFQLQNNWKWMVIKIPQTKTYEKHLRPQIHIIRNKSWKFTLFVPILGT